MSLVHHIALEGSTQVLRRIAPAPVDSAGFVVDDRSIPSAAQAGNSLVGLAGLEAVAVVAVDNNLAGSGRSSRPHRTRAAEAADMGELPRAFGCMTCLRWTARKFLVVYCI